MCHKDDCALMVLQEIIQYLAFCFGIEGAGGFVEQHDTSWTKQRTGNRYTLSLTFTQAPTLF